MNLLLKYIKPQGKRIARGTLIKVFGTLMDLVIPLLLGHIVNTANASGSMKQILFWGGVMLVCALLCYILNVTANRMTVAVSRDITKSLRYDLYEKIFSLSCSQADRMTSSSLVSRMTSDTYNIHIMIDRMQRMGIRGPILIIGGIVSSFFLDAPLTLIMLAVLPFLVFVVTKISKSGVVLFGETQKTLDKMVRKVQENMSGVRIIKALSKTEYENEQFQDINDALMEKDKKASQTMALSNPIIQFVLNIGLTLVVLFGAFRVNEGLTQPGTIIAFLNYFIMILNALLFVTRLFMLYSKGMASAQRISEVFELPACDVGRTHLSEEAKPSEYVLAMDNVSFSYNKKKNNLDSISFALKKGQTLGIIGSTGSGKSTLLLLALRLYAVDSGKITVFGKDIRTIPSDYLYENIGVVFQNDFLFADTLRENICFGRLCTEKAIEKAIDIAQADFIHEKENGLNFPLSIRGQNLSGGQKQRVLIARAISTKPKLLFLDDCTSALDYKTDANLRNALKNASPDTTKVIVSQRVSTIKDATQIIVLDDGKAIGQGTHEELLRTCPTYAQIYKTQMGEDGAYDA